MSIRPTSAVTVPDVSFIVLTKNSEEYLESCLDSIFSQKGFAIEIVIVDAGSTDGTKRILERYLKAFRTIVVLDLPDSSIGAARKAGTDTARGDYCAFIDSDCILPSDQWLNLMMKGFGSDTVAGTWTLGAFHPGDPGIMRYTILSNPWRRDPPDLVGQDNFIPIGTGHTILRKKNIMESGGFRDISSTEDIDLIFRIARLGFLFCYVHGAEVYHYHVTSFHQLIKKMRRNLAGGMESGAWQEEYLGSRKLHRQFIQNTFNATIFVPFLYSVVMAVADRDAAWLWHPFVSFSRAVLNFQVFYRFTRGKRPI